MKRPKVKRSNLLNETWRAMPMVSQWATWIEWPTTEKVDDGTNIRDEHRMTRVQARDLSPADQAELLIIAGIAAALNGRATGIVDRYLARKSRKRSQ